MARPGFVPRDTPITATVSGCRSRWIASRRAGDAVAEPRSAGAGATRTKASSTHGSPSRKTSGFTSTSVSSDGTATRARSRKRWTAEAISSTDVRPVRPRSRPVASSPRGRDASTSTTAPGPSRTGEKVAPRLPGKAEAASVSAVTPPNAMWTTGPNSSVHRALSSNSPPGSRSCSTNSATRYLVLGSGLRAAIAFMATATASGVRGTTRTPPSSVRCATSWDRSFTTTCNPGSPERSTTASALSTTSTSGTRKPRAERSSMPSASSRAPRPSARAFSTNETSAPGATSV